MRWEENRPVPPSQQPVARAVSGPTPYRRAASAFAPARCRAACSSWHRRVQPALQDRHHLQGDGDLQLPGQRQVPGRGRPHRGQALRGPARPGRVVRSIWLNGSRSGLVTSLHGLRSRRRRRRSRRGHPGPRVLQVLAAANRAGHTLTARCASAVGCSASPTTRGWPARVRLRGFCRDIRDFLPGYRAQVRVVCRA